MPDPAIMFQAICVEDAVHSLIQREERICDRLSACELRGDTDSPYYHELESAYRVNSYAIDCAQSELTYLDWLQSIIR